MKTFQIDPYKPSYKELREAADIVKAGGVMAYPTDTIYGLGCDVFHTKAIKKIEAAKERDKKPFSFVCKDIAQISQFAFLPNWAFRLMNRLLPGPYTFILEARKANLPKKMIGKRNTVGVRIPDNAICQTLVDLIDAPIVSTSINISGESPLSDVDHIDKKMAANIDVVINIGTIYGDPSTVIDATGDAPDVLRVGAGPVDW